MNSAIDRSAPGVRLSLLETAHAPHGIPLDLGDRLQALTFEDHTHKADTLTLRLHNADLALFDHEALFGGALLEVSWGYRGWMAPPRRVIVRRLTGFEILTVEGHALSVQMHQVIRTRSFVQRRRSDVVRQIAQEHGYTDAALDLDPTEEVLDCINQGGETDAALLRRLAAREGFVFFVDATGLHFHAERLHRAPTPILTWHGGTDRGDIVSVQVDCNLMRQVGKVVVRGRDPLRRTTVEASATNESDDRVTLSDVLEVVDPETGRTALEQRNATQSVQALPGATLARATREAKVRFRRAARQAVRVSMQVVGDPTLRAKRVIELRGLGTPLSGLYRVHSVKHSLSGSGYRCDLQLRREGLGPRRRGGDGPATRPQGGQPHSATPSPTGALETIEVVDPETGLSHLEYRAAGPSLAPDTGDLP